MMGKKKWLLLHGSFVDKFHWKVLVELDALRAFTWTSYHNINLYFTNKLIEHNKNK